MGKKRRKKSFRARAMKVQFPVEIRHRMNEQREILEHAFQESCDRVRTALSRFHPADVLVALNISDLWQANRASQVKHQLAFSLFVSLPADRFRTDYMVSYEDFAEFCSALIEALPDFPVLEDYVPEQDWGEVKVLHGEEAVAILYSGLVERIVDHIEAFRVCHGNGTQAAVDLEHSIRLQAELLQKMPWNGDNRADELNPGSIEVPPRFFWEAAKSALMQLSTDGTIRAEYVVELGQSVSWTGASSFSDAVMTGTALPWLAVRIDGALHAMSLRNATSVVIDAWAKASQDEPVRIAERLGVYLAKRIKAGSYRTGPLQICSRRECVPMPIACVLVDDMAKASDLIKSQDALMSIFLIVPVLPSQLECIGKIVTAMRRIMREADWGLQVIGSYEGFQFRDARGQLPGPMATEIILVSTETGTGFSVTKVPKTQARLMSLIDACTIFDSIESVNELTRFWSYVDKISRIGCRPFGSLVDLFASFRDKHGQIIEGAVQPNFLVLDPHWGTSWRYKQLKTFWNYAPLVFPDEDSAWQTEAIDEGSSPARIIAKNNLKLSWWLAIGECTLHFILDVDAVDLDQQDGRLLELFVNCAADSIAQRVSIISPFMKLPFRRVNLHCFSAPHLLASATDEQTLRAAMSMPLVTAWHEDSGNDLHSYKARLTVNLVKLVEHLKDVKDASFEVACAVAIVEGLFGALRCSMPSGLRRALEGTAGRRARFALGIRQRTVDVPEISRPQVPRPEDYGVARRELAVLLKKQEVTPGTYELKDAKKLIDPARTAYRDEVHQRIRTLDRESLLRYCVEQYDALIACYDALMGELSLSHEVDYNPGKSLAEAHRDFIRNSKNYRYLLESALVLTSPQASRVCPETVQSILAMVDWLFVLYEASDVLHNGMDVGGLRMDGQYVPEVFYSADRDEQELAFRQELAELQLGVDVMEGDRITTKLPTNEYLEKLDKAFVEDIEFSYSQMMKVLFVLIRWVSAGGTQELALSYVSDRRIIAERAMVVYPELPVAVVLKVLEFFRLAPDQIRRLIGKDDVEGDVPVWEHFKRGSRYSIRPLVDLPDGLVLWGAAAVERTKLTWMESISAGYLPADYDWPSVRSVVGERKKELEKTLEVRAYDVCARYLRYIEQGFDSRTRFPKHQFPDVGDFDVLAYRPEDNLWLAVECKYNKPVFCLKDARRLRDEIFGKNEKKFGQMQKIERRREFLTNNADKLRTLLGWPAPADKPFSLVELYVSKDMHFWLRFPPYQVPTHFVRIDTLDAWLRSRGLKRMYADQALENAAIKDVLSRKY